ncbi:hypothetical protein N665_0680s0016 [Sinapis alba]|nr:hypothetical protein N665_0680s0016 [Sinapis alba]
MVNLADFGMIIGHLLVVSLPILVHLLGPDSVFRFMLRCHPYMSMVSGSFNLLEPKPKFSFKLFLSTVSINEAVADEFIWNVNGIQSPSYSTKQVYNAIRDQGVQVPWEKMVWCKGGIPKHRFLTWLFVLNRCPTKDRILSWGLSTDPTCLFCQMAIESRDHLFFRCPFTWRLWCKVARRSDFPPTQAWDTTMLQLKALSGNKFRKRLIFLCWQATIYFIWTERNNRVHRQIFTPVETIWKNMERLLRNKFSSHRDENPAISSRLLQLWNLEVLRHVKLNRCRNPIEVPPDLSKARSPECLYLCY